VVRTLAITSLSASGKTPLTLLQQNDTERCTSFHLNNTKWRTNSTVKLNNNADSPIASLTPAQCPFKFTFDTSTESQAVAVSGVKFFLYDGINDAAPLPDVSVKAYEAVDVGGASSWSDANGSGDSLSLANQNAVNGVYTHDFYVAMSASPLATGVKSGKFKITLTYI
jgi:hypothetical protein